MLDITIYSVSVFVAALVLINLALIIFLGSHDYSSRAFVFLAFFTALWVLARGIFHSINPTAQDIYFLGSTFSPLYLATLINKISFMVGSLIGSSFLLFSLSFPTNKPYPKTLILLITLFFAHVFLYLNPDLFLGNAFYVGGMERWGWKQGGLLVIYDLYFFALWLTGLFIIARKIGCAEGLERKRLLYVFFSISIGILPATLFTIILPRFNIFTYDWLTPLSEGIWPVVIGYSIIKYQQMNVRTVSLELIIFAGILLLFINLFI